MAVGDSFIVMLGRDVSLAEQQAKKEKKRIKKEKTEELSSFYEDPASKPVAPPIQ
jgi:Mn-dependent DtxR family transcriptional regulator